MKKFLLVFCCAMSFASSSFSQVPTWSEDIAPILYANCTKCHHPGGAGHFSLLTFSDAYAYAFQMEYQTGVRSMPPWPPDENYKHYARERVLSQTEIDKISQWVAGGRMQGDITLAPAQPVYNNASTLGTVDLSVRIPTYSVGSNSDVYRNFPLTISVPAGSYVTAMEVIPGNTHIVHHVLIYQDSTNVPTTLDNNDPGPGYTNAGGTGSLASKLLGGWTPGASPYYTPVGTGFRLSNNAKIVVQIHYPANSLNMVDSTRINFKITSVPQREITVWPILNHLQNINASINVPAGATRSYIEEEILPPGTDYTFLSAFPHMHLIGTKIKSWANKPSTNDTIRFVDVPDWDFHWQDTYVFPNSVKVPASSKLQATATYNNYLSQTVTAGNGTGDEMMMVFFGYMPYVNGDENLIIDRRVLPQGATTFCNGQSVVLKMIEGTGYSYKWYRNGTEINGATSFSYKATQAGNYHALITLGPNNSLTDTIAVNVVASPTSTITPVGSTALCPGTSVVLNASTGSGYTYQWFNNNTPIANATSSSYNTNAAGSYSVQVYNGCYANSSAVNITTASAPSATITPSGSSTFCQGDTVTLSAPAGLTYHWNTNATTRTIDVTQSGPFTVTVTNPNNCSAVSSVTNVTVNSLPDANITPDGTTTFCQGGSVNLSVPSALTYHWSNNTNLQTLTVTQSNSYSVTVTNANGCSAISSPVVVTVNPLPTATIVAGGPTSFCPGGSVLLTANANTSYHWGNSNATTQSITADQTGSYPVTVTNSNNCSNTASVNVTVFPSPDATITTNKPTTICPGDSVTLSAVAGLSYHWSNTAATQSITASVDDIFTVTVTDNNSCSAVSSPITVEVNNNAVAGVTTSGPTTFCEGSSVELTAANGSAYLWSNAATSSSINVNTSGSFTVTVTMSGSCVAISDTIEVIVNPNPAVPSIAASGSTVFCEGGSVDLSVAAGFNYQWSSGETSSVITVAQTGKYLVTITDSNSCSAKSDTTTVTVNSTPSVTLSGNVATLCTSASPVTLSEGVPSGGTFSGNGVSGSLFDPAVAGTGNHVVTYTFSDINSCSNSASETIAVTICSGINELSDRGFIISPNPSKGHFVIERTNSNIENLQLRIFDVSGKLIHSSVSGNQKTEINLAVSPSGCYLLQLKTEEETVYKKLIFQE